MPHRSVSIGTAVGLLHVFWPEFVEVDECVLISPVPENEPQHNLALGFDRVDTEAFLSKYSVGWAFKHKAGRAPTNDDDKYFDHTHPDFQLLCELGRFIAQMWFRKLLFDFAYYDFRVYYMQYDAPTVRFHRVRPNVHNWIDDDDANWADAIKRRELVIHDTRAVRTRQFGT